MNSSQAPPTHVSDQEKVHWFKRFLMFLLPQKYHRFLTPEVFIAWNVSSWATLGQVAIVSKWKMISGWWSSIVVPGLKASWEAVGRTIDFLIDWLSVVSH